VVGCGHYYIIGDNLTHNFQETILTLKTIGFVVKIMKQGHEVNENFP